jgi:hypothetical protein
LESCAWRSCWKFPGQAGFAGFGLRLDATTITACAERHDCRSDGARGGRTLSLGAKRGPAHEFPLTGIERKTVFQSWERGEVQNRESVNGFRHQSENHFRVF